MQFESFKVNMTIFIEQKICFKIINTHYKISLIMALVHFGKSILPRLPIIILILLQFRCIVKVIILDNSVMTNEIKLSAPCITLPV